jgi:hypothetical protein
MKRGKWILLMICLGLLVSGVSCEKNKVQKISSGDASAIIADVEDSDFASHGNSNIYDFAHISDDEYENYTVFITKHGKPNDINIEIQKIIEENDGSEYERKKIKIIYDYMDVYYVEIPLWDKKYLLEIISKENGVFPNGIRIGMSKDEFLAFFSINEKELKNWYLSNDESGLGMWIHFDNNVLTKIEWNAK